MFNDNNRFIKSFIINFLGKVINFIFSLFPIIRNVYPSITQLNSDVIVESSSESKASFTEASKTTDSTE
jgi:uncharacterized membrane protein